MRSLIALLLVLSLGVSASAEPRWVLGAKTGAGSGTAGIEVEREFSNGLSLLTAAGVSGDAVGLALIGRSYFGKEQRSRFFWEILLGFISVPTELGPLGATFLGIAGGFDWRPLPWGRVSVEAGLSLAFVLIFPIPLPFAGISIGYVF